VEGGGGVGGGVGGGGGEVGRGREMGGGGGRVGKRGGEEGGQPSRGNYALQGTGGGEEREKQFMEKGRSKKRK